MIVLSLKGREKAMPTYDERLATLEQTTVTLRAELSQALNKIRQLEQFRIDSNHQQTLLLGIAYGQEASIKAIQGDVSVLKQDMQSVKGRLDEHTSMLNQHTSLLTQILARLPEKS